MKSTKIFSTKPSTFTFVWRTRVGSTWMRATVRQVSLIAPWVTGARRRPMSCWRAGSMVTGARPFTGAVPSSTSRRAPALPGWVPSLPAETTGTSFIPQIGQSPGWSEVIAGCMGHW
jgi:hypothetical protein